MQWDEVNQTASAARNPWPMRMWITTAVCAFLALIAFAAFALMNEKQPIKRQIVQISLLKPPPPAPPPPPPEQKLPEPQVKEEVELPEPEAKPAEAEAPPPGEQLGLDANGSGESDGFGLAAKKNGNDITTIGGGGNGNRAHFALFTGLVQRRLQEQFLKNDKLRRSDYRAVVSVWFTPEGTVDRYELIGSSGNPEVDQNIKISLQDMPALKQPPPADLPQPVRLRVTSRGAG